MHLVNLVWTEILYEFRSLGDLILEWWLAPIILENFRWTRLICFYLLSSKNGTIIPIVCRFHLAIRTVNTNCVFSAIQIALLVNFDCVMAVVSKWNRFGIGLNFIYVSSCIETKERLQTSVYHSHCSGDARNNCIFSFLPIPNTLYRNSHQISHLVLAVSSLSLASFWLHQVRQLCDRSILIKRFYS